LLSPCNEPCPLGPRPRYQPVLDAVNQKQERYAAQHAQRVLYADCTTPFLLPGGGRGLDPSLVPDGCHPEGPGPKVMAECVLRALQQALGDEQRGQHWRRQQHRRLIHAWEAFPRGLQAR
jgi:hypothetical protein